MSNTHPQEGEFGAHQAPCPTLQEQVEFWHKIAVLLFIRMGGTKGGPALEIHRQEIAHVEEPA